MFGRAAVAAAVWALARASELEQDATAAACSQEPDASLGLLQHKVNKANVSYEDGGSCCEHCRGYGGHPNGKWILRAVPRPETGMQGVGNCCWDGMHATLMTCGNNKPRHTGVSHTSACRLLPKFKEGFYKDGGDEHQDLYSSNGCAKYSAFIVKNWKDCIGSSWSEFEAPEGCTKKNGHHVTLDGDFDGELPETWNLEWYHGDA